MLFCMSDQSPFTQLYIQCGWSQPAALTTVLGSANIDPGLTSQLPDFLFHTRHDDDDEVWQLWSRVFSADSLDNQGCAVPLDNARLIASNMTENQKDIFLYSLRDDALKATLYAEPESLNSIIRTQKAKTYKPSAHFSPPKILTTKQVFIPPDKKRTHQHPSSDELFSYTEKNISRHKNRYISDEYWQVLRATLSHHDDMVYPTQFIALHTLALCDAEGMMHGGNDAAYYFNRQKKPELDSKDILLPQDIWRIYALEPYQAKILAVDSSLTNVKIFLMQLEAEFINPYYNTDKVLDWTENKLSNALKNYHPAHHAHLSLHQAKSYDDLINRKPEYILKNWTKPAQP